MMRPPEPNSIEVGGIRMVVHRSGDRRSLRVWDPEGEMARGFLGFKWFDIQIDYRVTGRFIPDASPRDMKVMNTLGDIDTYKTEGVVEFTLQGRTLRLRPFTTRPKRFYFVFKDRVERCGNLRGGEIPLLRPPRRRHDGARLQSSLQPAVLVQSLHHVPDSAPGEPAAGESAGRRTRLSRARPAAEVIADAPPSPERYRIVTSAVSV